MPRIDPLFGLLIGVLAVGVLIAIFRRDRTQIQDWPARVFSPKTSGAASARRGSRTPLGACALLTVARQFTEGRK